LERIKEEELVLNYADVGDENLVVQIDNVSFKMEITHQSN